MPSPSTRMHGPPYTTLSASPFSWMYLITASSSAPGWSQSAGTERALACSRMPRVTYSFTSRVILVSSSHTASHVQAQALTFGGVMILTDVCVGLGRSASA